MSARIEVSRKLSFGFELRRGLYEILLDGTNVGTLANNESAELSLEAGRHTLRIRKGRYSSRELSFEAENGGVTNFLCHGIRIWPLYIASIFVPSLAISLRQE
jgi:hypothetical protein